MTNETYILKRLITTGIVLLALILLFPLTSAHGQARDVIEGELETTDEIIERATEAVNESGSLIAQQHLERAITLQRAAWEAYHSNQLLRAAQFTKNARNQAKKAIGILQNAEQNHGIVMRELERTDDEITRSRDVVRQSGSDNAFAVLESSIKVQTEAKEYFRSNRLKISLTATLKARETARKANDLAAFVLEASDRLESELAKTDNLIETALEVATDLGVNGSALDLIHQAQEIQRQAHAEFKSGRLRASKILTDRARSLAQRALNEMETQLQPGRVKSFIEKTEAIILEAREFLDVHSNSQAENLLDKAEEHQASAQSSLASENVKKAIVEAKAARDLANRALNLLEG